MIRKINKIGTRSLNMSIALGILTFLIYACSSAGDSGGEDGVGSISFDFVLATPERFGALSEQQLNQAEFPCEENGVETIEAQALDENEVLLAEGGPWLCTDGEGTISDVEAGDNRIVKIIARNSEGDIVFAGRSEPFSIRAGETTTVGTIELVVASLRPVTIADTAITDEDSAVTISVLGNDADPYYNSQGDYFGTLDPTTVTVSSPPLSGNTEVNANGTITYTPDAISNGEDSFTYTVQDNLGATSEITAVTVTVNPIPEPPGAPQGVTATPGIGQITLNWLQVTDATTYNVYFSQTSGVSKDNFEGVFNGIGQTSFIHSNLMGGDSFFYVVTAKNNFGESAASAEVSATVPVNSRLIDDFVGTGFGSDPWTALFDAKFDGSGGGTYQEIFNSDIFLENGTYTYDLDIDGSMSATLSTGVEFSGILSADDNIFAVADTDFLPDDFIEMDVAIKKSTGLTDAILNGDYIGVRISSFGSTALISATFDGNGGGTFTYSVDSDGGVAISSDGFIVARGIVTSDGTVVSIVDTDSSDDEISMAIFIKSSAGLSNATLNGDYVGVSFGYFIGDGTIEETTVTRISADGNGNMAFEILSNSSGRAGTTNATYNVDPSDGSIRISLPTDEVSDGVINADGEIFNFVNTELIDSIIEIGVAIRKTP
jgi:hypothetical protein